MRLAFECLLISFASSFVLQSARLATQRFRPKHSEASEASDLKARAFPPNGPNRAALEVIGSCDLDTSTRVSAAAVLSEWSTGQIQPGAQLENFV